MKVAWANILSEAAFCSFDILFLFRSVFVYTYIPH